MALGCFFLQCRLQYNGSDVTEKISPYKNKTYFTNAGSVYWRIGTQIFGSDGAVEIFSWFRAGADGRSGLFLSLKR